MLACVEARQRTKSKVISVCRMLRIVAGCLRWQILSISIARTKHLRNLFCDVHLDERWLGAFESFAGEFVRVVAVRVHLSPRHLNPLPDGEEEILRPVVDRRLSPSSWPSRPVGEKEFKRDDDDY